MSKRYDKRVEARLEESRIKVQRMMDRAMGMYIEQEGKKGDTWRDQSYGQLFSHMRHEVEEIKRSSNRTFQLHNCLDNAILSILLACKVEEETLRSK